MRSFIAALFFITVAAPLAAQPTPELSGDALAQLTQRFLADTARRDFANADVRVAVDAPDARLRFPACANLTMTPHGARGLGRTSVTVRCDAPQSWAASLTATIEVWRSIAVAARALAGHAPLQANDIVMESRNLGELHGQYVESADRIVGWTTRRAIAPGTVLTLRQLAAPIAVNKGDEVRIRSGLGAIAVSMSGTALDNGMPGEQIPVRNTESARVIRAWVVEPGLVTTGPKP